MCMKIVDKTGKEIEIDLKDWQDVIKAINIIKKFGIDVRFFKKLFLIIQNRITEEKQERKEADKIIKDNYIDRFKKLEDKMDIVDGGIKKKIEMIDEKLDNVIELNNKEKIENIKRANKNLWAFILVILSSTFFLFITMIWDKIILFLKTIF